MKLYLGDRCIYSLRNNLRNNYIARLFLKSFFSSDVCTEYSSLFRSNTTVLTMTVNNRTEKGEKGPFRLHDLLYEAYLERWILCTER